MDPLEHTLAGAALGEIGFARRTHLARAARRASRSRSPSGMVVRLNAKLEVIEVYEEREML